MKRVPVESSQIKEIGYDEANMVLEVQFKRGNAVYQYVEVPPDVADNLIDAESLGKFFNANVRDKYQFTKLAPEESHASDEAKAAAKDPSKAPEDSQGNENSAHTDDSTSR